MLGVHVVFQNMKWFRKYRNFSVGVVSASLFVIRWKWSPQHLALVGPWQGGEPTSRPVRDALIHPSGRPITSKCSAVQCSVVQFIVCFGSSIYASCIFVSIQSQWGSCSSSRCEVPRSLNILVLYVAIYQQYSCGVEYRYFSDPVLGRA